MARLQSLASQGVPTASPPMTFTGDSNALGTTADAPLAADNRSDAESLAVSAPHVRTICSLISSCMPTFVCAQGGIAVVTGGASGIGLAVAHEALSRGLHVAIGDIQQDAIEPALAELRAAAGGGLAVEGFLCDVTDAAGVDAFAASVHGSTAFGGAPVTVLHCNAGIAVGASTLTSTPADWDFTFNVNVFGVAVSPAT